MREIRHHFLTFKEDCMNDIMQIDIIHTQLKKLFYYYLLLKSLAEAVANIFYLSTPLTQQSQVSHVEKHQMP